MNSLLKSAALVATILGVSATNLRVNDMELINKVSNALDLSNFENAFLEQGAAKYDCTGTTVNQIEQFAIKTKEEGVAEINRCVSNHARIDAAIVTEGNNYDGLLAKAASGLYPLKPDCIVATCATPKSTALATRETLKAAHKKAMDQAEKDALASAKLVADADTVRTTKRSLAVAASENEVKVRKAVVNARAELAAANTQAHAALVDAQQSEHKRLEGIAKATISAATDVSEHVVDECRRAYDEHTKLITRDSNTLADINTELAKLKLCPVQGTAAVFLEVDAAARLEAHCALTRQKVEAHGDLISTNGDIAKWNSRIMEEQQEALVTRQKCLQGAAGMLSAAIDNANKAHGKAYDLYNLNVNLPAFDALNKNFADDDKAQEDLLGAATKTMVGAQAAASAADDAYTTQVGEHAANTESAVAAKKILDEQLELLIADSSKSKNKFIDTQKLNLEAEKQIMIDTYGIEKTQSVQTCAEVLGEIKSTQNTLLAIVQKVTSMKVIGNYDNKQRIMATILNSLSDPSAAGQEAEETQLFPEAAAATGTTEEDERAQLFPEATAATGTAEEVERTQLFPEATAATAAAAPLDCETVLPPLNQKFLPKNLDINQYMGCAGAVWTSGKGSQKYCEDDDRFPWYQKCCSWDASISKCVAKSQSNVQSSTPRL